MNITMHWERSWKDEFAKRIERDGPWSNWELYELALEATKSLAIPQFDGLQAPNHLPHVTILPHQYDVARQVVEQMNGKAILADEVGLGKTIEAGLILKEYMIRGLVQKALILVPASLVSQWVQELNEKFFIPAVAQRKSYVWEQCDIVVSSIDTAKKQPHRDIIYGQTYDMVIIDEAHKLKNNKTKNYEFVQGLKKKFCLLLTATPIQNRVEEIFHLVSLLKPGHLGNAEQFQKKYGKLRTLHDDAHLKELIRKVMIRHRRHDTGIGWTKRHVETFFIDFSEAERNVYETIQQLKTHFSDTSLSHMTLLREICSSKEALFCTLKNMFEQKPHLETTIGALLQKMNDITDHTKAKKALELIQTINDKVIVFTEYRATQLYLQWFFKQHGISSVPFRGGFKRSKKDWMKELFQHRAQVLIATEAGGEGINLQFCHHVINYDLPWNPMRLEQRIGRVHRLGQTKDVHIYNFVVRNTIEEHMFTLLYEKIQLFERVVGELDDILMKLQSPTFSNHLERIIAQSKSEGELKIKIQNFVEIFTNMEDNVHAAT
ncbi:DEAD/DEAH box helicase [Anoxybacillus flavithermus]|uniref:DEAD/DEAH box helicase n=1 Tax=Anoxybacillus flavithermus TaxID=33934 RepID=UPI00186655AF|nr:SNF2-related protein [Anoxybacillus flavithermus]MBE2939369.1 DEAD/DEAH box helicase [Anoxybacillus flavithermus]MBE2942066.1 DEAD/DEAH box helicase [Anoxybacillus flavithermus]MBE2950303.1 DEAD/DEAH box helicase [Anoxybacillus flavithermus]MBE2952899.1 DEAD/DEAH box helicase [Anoxybacillus flavithermus]MBE2958252.1 DEAD/DEAH box helicase [Anoxybacillus flavithermus]